MDGSDVADRATSGEPQEDGQSFGSSIADEALEGTPAENLRENRGDAAGDHRPDTPTGGPGTADEQRPDAPSGAADVTGNRPDGPTTGNTGGQSDLPSAGGADTAAESHSTPPTAGD